jgi:FkbM family methyltransferase
MLSARQKEIILGFGRFLPGRVGERIETRWLRRTKSRLAAAAVSEFHKRLSELPPDAVGLDLGANVGDITRVLAKHCSVVHAFEPDPWSFSQLQKNTADLTNVILHNAAVSLSDEKVLMRRSPGFGEDPRKESLGTSIQSFTTDLVSGETFLADCIDLRRFIADLTTSSVFVKMDIEGAEVPILEDLITSPEISKISNLFVETHEVNMPSLRSRLAQVKLGASQVKGTYVNFDWP